MHLWGDGETTFQMQLWEFIFKCPDSSHIKVDMLINTVTWDIYSNHLPAMLAQFLWLIVSELRYTGWYSLCLFADLWILRDIFVIVVDLNMSWIKYKLIYKTPIHTWWQSVEIRVLHRLRSLQECNLKTLDWRIGCCRHRSVAPPVESSRCSTSE